MADVEELRDRLTSIADDLTELAINALRDAVEAGEDKRPDLEKQLTRARGAVEKAATILDAVTRAD